MTPKIRWLQISLIIIGLFLIGSLFLYGWQQEGDHQQKENKTLPDPFPAIEATKAAQENEVKRGQKSGKTLPQVQATHNSNIDRTTAGEVRAVTTGKNQNDGSY